MKKDLARRLVKTIAETFDAQEIEQMQLESDLIGFLNILTMAAIAKRTSDMTRQITGEERKAV